VQDEKYAKKYMSRLYSSVKYLSSEPIPANESALIYGRRITLESIRGGGIIEV
jgi:hypothetical protein